MGERRERKPLSELGHWEPGPVFVFNEPFRLPSGHLMRKADLSLVQMDDGMRVEWIIEALTDPQAQLAAEDDEPGDD